MTTFLIGPFSKAPVAAIEEKNGTRKLKIFDENLKKCLDINGITQSEKRHGVWRVFPDGSPQIFLEAFEKDFVDGLAGKGYCWIKQEDYEDKESWIAKMVSAVIQV